MIRCVEASEWIQALLPPSEWGWRHRAYIEAAMNGSWPEAGGTVAAAMVPMPLTGNWSALRNYLKIVLRFQIVIPKKHVVT